EKSKEGANLTIDTEAPKEEGDYGAMILGLTLAAATQLAPDKKQSEFESVQSQVAMTIALFIEQSADHNDYTAAVQRPFFAAMEKVKLVDTFAAIAITPLKRLA